MDLREFRVVVRIVDRVAKRALFAEEQMVALEGQCAEWKRLADELKAERDAERKAHDEYKERNREIFNGNQRLTAELAVIKDERDALRAECDDLRRVFSMVHGSLGIRQGQHIGNAIDALKKERDELATRLRQSIARGDFAEMRAATLLAELAEQKPSFDPTVAKMESTAEASHDTPAGKETAQAAAEPNPVNVPRAHPVKVGEYVKNDNGDVCQVHEVYAEYLLNTGWTWAFENCTPCDPPTASHITPEGKRTAEGAVEPKPGDVVRLEEDK